MIYCHTLWRSYMLYSLIALAKLFAGQQAASHALSTSRNSPVSMKPDLSSSHASAKGKTRHRYGCGVKHFQAFLSYHVISGSYPPRFFLIIYINCWISSSTELAFLASTTAHVLPSSTLGPTSCSSFHCAGRAISLDWLWSRLILYGRVFPSHHRSA